MLYNPGDFEALTDERWSEHRIRAGIREIVADTDAAYRGPKLLWRADDWDRWLATSPLKTLYCGAAGVLWALDDLRRRGHAETTLVLADVALDTLERQRARPEHATKAMSAMALPEPRQSSLLCGEAGILLVAHRLGATDEIADALFERVHANVENEAEELMWGSPGTLVASRLMFDWTGDARWRAAWNESAEALLARRDADGLWTQSLYGYVERMLGPVHGFVGNVLALGQVLPARRRDALYRSSADVLARTPVSRTVSPTGQRSQVSRWPTSEGRFGCSGATARPAWSRPLPSTSTRSFSWRVRSSPGGLVRTGTSAARRSATAPPAMATRS